MNLRLFGCMLNLLIPPRATSDHEDLLAALDRHTSATKQVVQKASNIDRALLNIQEAGEGIFA